MRAHIISIALLLGCGGLSDSIKESNELAQLDDGSVCIEDNSDMLDKGWTAKQIQSWCIDPEKWHERMIADKCRACPECCIVISD